MDMVLIEDSVATVVSSVMEKFQHPVRRNTPGFTRTHGVDRITGNSVSVLRDT